MANSGGFGWTEEDCNDHVDEDDASCELEISGLSRGGREEEGETKKRVRGKWGKRRCVGRGGAGDCHFGRAGKGGGKGIGVGGGGEGGRGGEGGGG
eukprot:762572-Hanusia_phi.AAC.1